VADRELRLEAFHNARCANLLLRPQQICALTSAFSIVLRPLINGQVTALAAPCDGHARPRNETEAGQFS
jgi:hypothetical protein